MIPQNIIDLMDNQKGSVKRPSDQVPIVISNSNKLGITPTSEFTEFFIKYRLSGVLSNKEFELLDMASPTSQIVDATNYAIDIYGLPQDFICLTSGEGEGFIIFSKIDSGSL